MKMQTCNKSKITLVALLIFFLLISMTATAVSAADADWIQTVSVDKPAVESDMVGLVKGVDANAITSPQNWQTLYTNFQTYSIALMTDSQKALDHSESYIVSSDLEPTKAAYENAMKQANWAGFYANKYVTDTASGNGAEAANDLLSTSDYITSYNTNMNEASRLYDIYLKSNA